jgi:flagellum-specific ATP synthase
LAVKNHYPAVDVMASVSRVMRDVVDAQHIRMANDVMNIVATYRKAEDLINIGAYVEGSNPEIDYARKMIDQVNRFVCQDIDERAGFEESKRTLVDLFGN